MISVAVFPVVVVCPADIVRLAGLRAQEQTGTFRPRLTVMAANVKVRLGSCAALQGRVTLFSLSTVSPSRPGLVAGWRGPGRCLSFRCVGEVNVVEVQDHAHLHGLDDGSGQRRPRRDVGVPDRVRSPAVGAARGRQFDEPAPDMGAAFRHRRAGQFGHPLAGLAFNRFEMLPWRGAVFQAAVEPEVVFGVGDESGEVVGR